IKFITTDWGSKLIVHHELERAGVIGVAGGKYIPSAPSGWYTDNENALINIVQTQKDNSKSKIQTFSGVEKAFALDGVFLSIKKQIFKQYKFDEHLTGYHGYDTEITLRIAKNYINYVISDILIDHFSAGNPDQKWFEANIYIRKKLGSDFKHLIDKNLEFNLYRQFLKQYFEYYSKTYRNLFKTIRFFPSLKIEKRKYLKLLLLIYSILHE
ncbi:glycosyltransferase, partial [Kaistella carnis]